MNKYLTVLALYMVLASLSTGCSSSKYNFAVEPGGSSTREYYDSVPAPASAPMAQVDSYSYNNALYDMEYQTLETDVLGTGVDPSAQEQKIIIEAELTMATDRFDEVTSNIRNIAVGNGGYVQNSEFTTLGDGIRHLMITIRIPYEQYESVASQIKGLCVLFSATENQRNATAEYYDIQSRLQTKRIEEERLLALIDRTQSIEDILELESLLGQVRTQIEVYQTQMTSIDRLSSYSTINVYLNEVMDETTVIIPTNLSGRVYESFIKSVNSTIRFAQGILILLVRISVPLFVALVAAVIIWGLFKLRRAIRRKREQKK